MVEETIKTIRETEREAEKLVREADEKYTAILADARKEADSLKNQAEADAKEKARKALDVEREIGEGTIKDALARVESDIEVLKESARAKESEVIAAVIAELV